MLIYLVCISTIHVLNKHHKNMGLSGRDSPMPSSFLLPEHPLGHNFHLQEIGDQVERTQEGIGESEVEYIRPLQGQVREHIPAERQFIASRQYRTGDRSAYSLDWAQ